MNWQDHSQDQASELAALYASGAMPPEEMVSFEGHLRDCSTCRSQVECLLPVVEKLLGEAGAVAPSPAVREKLLDSVAGSKARIVGTDGADHDQVWRDWQTDATHEMVIRRGGPDVWEETGVPGISVRRLFIDRDRNEMTALFRMAAGTSYPRHIHDGAEQCLVLEGELNIGDTVLRAGDYQRLPAGSQHPVQSTEQGCVLLIVSSLTDEIF